MSREDATPSPLEFTNIKEYASKYTATMPCVYVEESDEQSSFPNLTLSDVVKRLESIAPLKLAEPWDNVGLLIEPYDNKKIIKKILLTIDLTEDVLNEAVQNQTDLIISYHPPIFVPVKKVNNNKWKERIISTCLAHNIAVYSPHTSLDALQGGVNDWLASIYHLKEYSPIVPATPDDKFTNIVVINHKTNTAEIENHLIEIGKNAFGENYKNEISINPVANFSTHVLTTENGLGGFLSGLYSANKKYDTVSVAKRPLSPSKSAGTGRMCVLKESIPLLKAVKKMKAHLNKLIFRIALPIDKSENEIMINSIAVCAGSGGSVLKGVKADLYITGEMSHHDVLDAIHKGTTVLLLEHSDSERTYLEPYAILIRKRLHNYMDYLQVDISQTDREHICYI